MGTREGGNSRRSPKKVEVNKNRAISRKFSIKLSTHSFTSKGEIGDYPTLYGEDSMELIAITP